MTLFPEQIAPAPAPSDHGGPTPLIGYTLRGLRRCWMPQHGRWSHRYHLDGRAEPNESVAASDLYYSLNVLLGLSRVGAALAAESYDVPGTLDSIALRLLSHPVRNRAWGMALWAAAALNRSLPGPVMDHIRALAADPAALARWTAQDVSLLLSGAVAQLPDGGWRDVGQAVRTLLMDRFRGPRRLFFDGSAGLRREFGSFATQVYCALALYQWAEATGDASALAAANSCLACLIELQGPQGEWPWFFLSRADRVVDFYEVYSVHQHGMAPAILHHAVRHDVSGARQALVKGFGWLFGANGMGVSMLRPDLQLIHRSQRRAGLQGDRTIRAALSIGRALTGTGAPLARSAGQLRLTQEVRSYELGWTLWSFGGRRDYPELTDRPEFIVLA